MTTVAAMTSAGGSRARWGTAALVAPAGAALLAGTTGWALHHAPGSSASVATTSAPTPSASGPSAAALRTAALRRQVVAEQQRLAALKQAILATKAQTSVIEAGTAKLGSRPAQVYVAAPVAPAYSGGSAYVPSPAPAPAAAPQQQAAPPAAQATTRASGARP